MTDRPIPTDAEGRHSADSLRATLIRRPRSALYGYWRDLLNLPVFSETVKSVEVLDATHSRWVVEGPGGKEVALTSMITEDLTDRRIAWTSTEGLSLIHI